MKSVYGDEFIMASTSDIYGGQQLNLSINPHYAQLLRWLHDFKRQHDAEVMLRESSEAVKNAWEQYQVVKALAVKETEK